MRWFLALFLLTSTLLPAQYRLEVNCPSCDKNKFESQFKDSISIIKYLQEQRITFLGKGYAEASFDSLKIDSTSYTTHLHLGGKYKLALLNLDSIPLILRPRHFSLTQKETHFSPLELRAYLNTILLKSTQNGYPLAQVYLDSILLKDHLLSARLILKKGFYIQYGKVIIKGNTGIKNSFVYNYLDLKPQKPFNINHLDQITNRIDNLDFMTITASPNVRFYGSEAIVTLVLKEKKANQFNFLIGVLPNNTETKKLLLVGNILMDFKNMLGYGERFYFKFDQTRPQTQQLDLKVDFPYPLGLPVGVAADFDLYKRDTNYLDVKGQLAVQYSLRSHEYLKFYWQNKQSNLLTINKVQLLLSKQLPNNLDYNSNLFGLEYGLSKVDYRFNPRKGISFHLNAGAGFIRRPKNPKIIELTIPTQPEFSFSQLYDSIGVQSWQIQTRATLNTYLPIFKHSVIAIKNHTGWIYSPIQPRQNELYRIGGNRLLRGFDEESIFASFYNISTLEYRLIIANRSYLFAFGDYGFVQTPIYVDNQITNSQLVGFGAGMSFETKAGNFRISYALGKHDTNPIDTRSSKIHLGYQSLF